MTTRPWEKVSTVVGKELTPIMRQSTLEVLIDLVVGKLNNVGAFCRVEYQNGRARVLGSNGQKVLVQLL